MNKLHNGLAPEPTVNIPFVDGLIRRTLDQKGPTRTILDPRLQPVIEARGRAHLEDEWVQGIAPWGLFTSAGPVAAQNGIIGVQNPVGSGKLVCVEWAYYQSGSGGYLGFCLPAAVASLSQVSPRATDGRLWSATNWLNVLSTIGLVGTVASFMAAGDAIAVNIGNEREYDIRVVLRPGQCLVFQCNTVNTACQAAMRGYERVANAGELG